MATVRILRKLWRVRLLVGVVALLALGLGINLTYRLGLPPQSRQYEVGVADGRILVDTPKSQFVEVAPLGAASLGQRANLLAALMTEGDAKAAIARRAGLAPDDLLAVSESDADPAPVSPDALNARDAHRLTTRVVRDSDGLQLPIIQLDAQAPDPAAATRLVAAAIDGLNEYLDSKAALQQITDHRRLQVSALGIDPGRLQVRGPGLLIGVGAAILAFLTGCSLILGVAALARNWREVEASELGGHPAANARPAVVPGPAPPTPRRADVPPTPTPPAPPRPTTTPILPAVIGEHGDAGMQRALPARWPR
jgi:hypothetical protein